MYASTAKYTLKNGDYLAYTRNLLDACEEAAPGSTGTMKQFLPDSWPFENTSYYQNPLGYCRVLENRKPECYGGFHERVGIGRSVVNDVPRVKQSTEVVEWREALDMALTAAHEAIKASRQSILPNPFGTNPEPSKPRQISPKAIHTINLLNLQSPSTLPHLIQIFWLQILVIGLVITVVPLEWADFSGVCGMVYVLCWATLVLAAGLMPGGSQGEFVKVNVSGGVIMVLFVALVLQIVAMAVRFWQMREFVW